MKQLTEQQLKAAAALARGLSQTRAAELAGVTRRSVVRWLREPFFRSEVECLKTEVKDVRVETVERIVAHEEVRLQDLLPKALAVVQEILDSPDSRTADRLKAAALVCDWGGIKVAAQNKLDQQQFPSDIPTLEGGGEVDFSSLSDEELNRLYLEKLPGGSK